MAGSGKTTLMQRMISHLAQRKVPRYVVNVSGGLEADFDLVLLILGCVAD